MAPVGFADKVAFVWKVADKLPGTFKQHEHGWAMLPLLVLCRMDTVLAPTKDRVPDTAVKTGVLAPDHKTPDDGSDPLLKRAAGQRFYNLSPLTFTSMLQNDRALAEQPASYVRRLSPDAYAVMEAYNLDDKIQRMDRAGILYPVLADIADLDVRPTVVSNEAMGYVFEELLRKFSEMSNETAGAHYTPREDIDLMVELLLQGTHAELTANPKPVRTVYGPDGRHQRHAHGCAARHHGRQRRRPRQGLWPGVNAETWAIAQSDLMMQDTEPQQMASGNSLPTRGDKVWVAQQWAAVRVTMKWKPSRCTTTGRSIVLENKIKDLLLDRLDENGELFDQFLANPNLQHEILAHFDRTPDKFRKRRTSNSRPLERADTRKVP